MLLMLMDSGPVACVQEVGVSVAAGGVVLLYTCVPARSGGGRFRVVAGGVVLYLCPSMPGGGRGTIPVSQPGQEVGVVLYLCPS